MSKQNLLLWVKSTSIEELYRLLDAASEKNKGKVEILIRYKLGLK